MGFVCVVLSAATSLAQIEGKEIYGTDDRIDMFAEGDLERRRMARAVCALVSATLLEDTGNGAYRLLGQPAGGQGQPLCPDERFADQPALAFCSGFLVGPDIIVTAGHCVLDFDLEVVRVLFGFEMLNATTPVEFAAPSDVYEITEVVQAVNNGLSDFAVLRLDRAVTAPGAFPLEVRAAGRVEPGTRVGVIGHPLGLPTKISFGETTTVQRSLPGLPWFTTNIDASEGNSGSPVINAATGVVEGVYVRSSVDDFEFDPVGDCVRVNMVADEMGRQEVVRAPLFADVIASAEPRCGRPVGQPKTAATDWLVLLMLVGVLCSHRDLLRSPFALESKLHVVKGTGDRDGDHQYSCDETTCVVGLHQAAESGGPKVNYNVVRHVSQHVVQHPRVVCVRCYQDERT